MILYDDKHNFLGMSSHTLGFLGYEDIGDFLSMHNDFSNLFVNKEGFIYNYDNFNWIDFVLYSGSANKSAIVTLKNGRETKVDITIKEVHLGHELEGIKKLFSVKLISDKFHEISGVPKNDEGVGGISGFTLSGLVEKEVQKENFEIKSQPELIIQSTPQEDKKNDSFILNIAEEKEKPKEEMIKEVKATDTQDDFKLDFFKEDTSSKESNESSDFTLLQMDSQPDEVKEEPINFLLKEDESLSEKPSSTPDTETLTLNLLNSDEMKSDEQIDTPPLDMESNFLKTEDTHVSTTKNDSEEIKEDEPFSKIKESGFKLDFLNMQKDPVSKSEKSTQKIESKEDDAPNYNLIDHTEVIQQIKRDIKEIDNQDKEIIASNKSENETFVLDIPKMPQVEQPLDLDKEEQLQTTNDKVQETNHVDTLSSFQIQESKELNSNKSFTSTLRGLFGDKQNLDETNSTIDDAFNFNLLSDKAKSEEKTQEISENREEHVDKAETVQEVTLSSLAPLGLSPDDEFDLMSDFINDVKESIENIEQFTQTKDFDKINYSLVKIKSSAEILNLNDIIVITNNIREYCATKNSEKVIQETKNLKENIKMIEKHLKVAAI